MEYPKYINNVETITLKDDLSEFLGTFKNGIIEISYLDIVKMAGHSCGVVSGAYLMALKGLKALYGNDIPKRGEIKVELRGTLEDNTGVTAQVLSNITGAATDNGFLGIKGKFNRRGLLTYGNNIPTTVKFTRLDTNEAVYVNYLPGKVVKPKELLQTAIAENATDEDKKSFPQRWQEMVKTIFDNADKVIEISK